MPIFDVVIEYNVTKSLCVSIEADTDSEAAAQGEQMIADCHRDPETLTECLGIHWDTLGGAVEVVAVELAHDTPVADFPRHRPRSASTARQPGHTHGG